LGTLKIDVKCPDRCALVRCKFKETQKSASENDYGRKNDNIRIPVGLSKYRLAQGPLSTRNMARFTEWFEQLNNAGRFKGGGPLGHYGKTLAGRRVVTDGPFAESKEAIAGFFLIQADSLEQAVEVAKGCPGLEFGQTVEVRAMVQEPGELQIARQRMADLQTNPRHPQTGRYATVNGLKMYYEIHGSGRPLVLLHGGGSTINSTFGRILPELARRHQVIAVELQAHGHTPDIDRPLSFEQDADDVAGLLKQLTIEKADLMGFSNGGTTCLQIALRHPELPNKLVLASTTYKRDGMQPGFWEGMRNASLENMPHPLKEAGTSPECWPLKISATPIYRPSRRRR
jgi:hypothetical protein